METRTQARTHVYVNVPKLVCQFSAQKVKDLRLQLRISRWTAALYVATGPTHLLLVTPVQL